ncbi:iron-containing alcohol dehydrogenase [candidate division KSB1 bacterium]|nr:iron-containing alcohol dehydrogenase [candidate division KSB1 bacterium]
MEFSFFMGTRIFFGSDSFAQLRQIIKSTRYSRIGIVVDHNLTGLPITQDLLSVIKENTGTITNKVTVTEPTYRYLEEIRQPFMESGIQAVVGIGGGSALDTAKAVAVLVNNKDKAITYRGFDKMTEPVLPVLAIPTTAGTGSEVTLNASFIDDDEKRKLGINGEAIRPQYAFLNPKMVVSCPKEAAVSAGLDALVHAVEAFAAKKSTYVSRIFSREAVRLVLNNLEKAVLERNESALEQVFLGSMFAGIAMMNSGTGPAAAFSYPLGVHKKVPHGLAGGVFLPMIMEWNVRSGYQGYGDLASMISMEKSSSPQDEKARYVVNRFRELWQNLGVPTDLKEYNFVAEDTSVFLNDILELQGALEQNPIGLGENEIKMFLESVL